jgi:hypothetical protein
MNLGTPHARILSLYLTVALFALTLPAPGWAMFLPAGNATPDRAAELSLVQSVLESRAVAQRLVDLGVTPDEALVKVRSLSDEQVHRLAMNLDSVAAGGDGLGAVIGLLLIAVIVVIVLQATGHEIIITK